MINNQEIMTLAVPLTNSIILAAVDTWIKPMFKKMKENHDFDMQFSKTAIDHFYEYLERAYKKQLIMNTIIFKNHQKTIDDLYIPLTIKSNINDNKISEKLDGYNEDLFSKFKKILIVDNAGMGKSTIMKWLFISIIRENKGIPIFVDLRRLSENVKIVDFIKNEVNGVNSVINEELLLHILERGDFIFFFDGYDEISVEFKKIVTEDLQSFIYKCSNNTFFMSSREENALSCFGDFARFSIVPLNTNEAYSLLSKYDNNGELSVELINKLSTDSNLSLLKEFLKNPMMTSLLYKAYEYKRAIPYKKHIFYRQVYNALFDEHDLSKGGNFSHTKLSNLDIEDFQRILRSFAFRTFIKGKNSYEKNELVSILSKVSNENPDIKFSINSFISDFTISVPLLIKDGIEYKWVHKSFQEYFTALYILDDAHDKKTRILKDILKSKNSSRYINVMDFFYDMDIKTFKSVVIKYIAEQYFEYYQSTITEAKVNGVEEKYVKHRIFTTFVINLFYFPTVNDSRSPQIIFEEKMKKLQNDPKAIDGLGFSASIRSGKETDMIIYQIKPIYNFLKLLINKNDTCILSTDLETYNTKITISNYNNCIFEFEYYHIDHDKDSILNNIDNYCKTTNLLVNELKDDNSREYRKRSIQENFTYIDIDKCIDLIQNTSDSYNESDFEIE